MFRRALIVVPVLALFVITSLIFLAARAPRTWATHWANPIRIVQASGLSEYGAVANRSGSWDIAWADIDEQRLVFSPGDSAAGGSLILDRGDISQPTLIRLRGMEWASWV